MNFVKQSNALISLSLFFFSSVLMAAEVKYDRCRVDFELQDRYHYSETDTLEFTLLDSGNLEDNQRFTIDYFPESEKVTLVRAYVKEPDGKIVPVGSDQIFERDSAENPEAPGFSKMKTKTIVFSQLKKGCHIYIQYIRQKIEPDLFGFYSEFSPLLNQEFNNFEVNIRYPKSLLLLSETKGGFKLTEKTDGNSKIMSAVLKKYPRVETEDGMVDQRDVLPYFIVSSLKTWEEVGRIVWEKTIDKQKITPRVEKLAKDITAGKKGKEAAEDIFYWVTNNIRYLNVMQDEQAGYIPKDVETILDKRFGDCKDHASLLHTLLKAAGVKSDIVAINSGHSYQLSPIPHPFANHVIVYLPEYHVFLDPTDASHRFGLLSSENAGKRVLAYTENPYFVMTPSGDPEEDRYEVHHRISITKDGDIKGEGEIHTFGEVTGRLRNVLQGEDCHKLANAILSATSEGGRGNFVINNIDDQDKDLVIQSHWVSPNAINVDKDAYFTLPIGIDLYPPSANQSMCILEQRHFPFLVGAISERWVYELSLPRGTKFKRLPKNATFTNVAGGFTTQYQLKDNKLIAEKSLHLNKDLYSEKDYRAVKQLIEKFMLDSRAMIGVEFVG